MKTLAEITCNERDHSRAEGGAEAHLIATFSRIETEAQRARRIARKIVNPETAEALRRLWDGERGEEIWQNTG